MREVRFLFSGEVGASLADKDHEKPVDNFSEHVKTMEGFHQRYMVSNIACRDWVKRVRKMNIDMIVPQHGKPFKGKVIITEFLTWFEALECGVDLMYSNNILNANPAES